MVDIARVFSPVVVFASGEARPQSSDRIRSASAKRISSASTRRTSRVSSAVSTVESCDSGIQGRHGINDVNDEKDLETELKAELTTPLTGIDLVGLINDKISKLDRALRSVDAPSDFNKNQILVTSEKLRATAIENGQSRQQVQQFAGLLAIKSTFQDQVTATVKPKTKSALLDQDQSTLLEIFQYPGFQDDRLTPLPFNVSLEIQIMLKVLPKQYTLARHEPHIKSLIELYYCSATKALILDIFWWVFLENYQNQPKIQQKLLERSSNNYVALLLMEIDLRYRDKCFQVYPSLLAETIFACFKVCFPASIKQMPVDADAAGKTKHENKNNPFDFGNTNDNPGQRIKELVNLDSFKNSITNVCHLWLSGLPAPPRRYEKWRSKIVQREKISFIDPTLTSTSPTDAPTTVSMSTTTAVVAPNTDSTLPSSLHGSKSAPVESNLSNARHISSRHNKRKEPYELLEEIFKHTNDPLPDRRVLYEDYLFDINGNSPLAEKFLRSRHLLKKAGTQLFITHPQISRVPTVNVETYDDEIKRNARYCRIVRAQKHKEQAEEKARRQRQLAKQRAVTSITRDELEKKKAKNSIYRQKMMMPRSDELVSISQLSLKLH